MITVTDSAVKHLQALVRDEASGDQTGLRIFVEKGGCAGMQYGMKLDSRKESDHVAGRDGAEILFDQESLSYLDGSTIDYSDDLTGSGFRIVNPNAVRSCGCGTSFEASAPEASKAH